MTFEITYKNAGGSVVRESIEADSRAAVFARMSSMGVSPISVRPSGGAPASARRARAVANPLGRRLHTPGLKWILAGAAALAICGGLLWFAGALDHDGADARRGKGGATARRRADVRRDPVPAQATPAVQHDGTSTAVEQSAEPSQEAREVDTYKGVEVVSRAATTNDTGFVYEKIRTADGKVHSVTHFPKPVFHHATDELLSMAVGSKGAQLPPLPQLGEADDDAFLASLDDPIVVSEEDDERTREAKLAVIAAREDMRMLVESGMTFREAIMEHHRLFNEGVELRSEVMREVEAMVKEGDIEDAESYLASVNALLEQKGIQPVEMPAKVRLPANGGM